MLFLLFPRDGSEYSSDTVDDHHSPSDKTTPVIIGVVVGGVAAIAITAGIIFFLIKKRKWDRLRQCEERLIDYQLATGYSSKLNSRSVTPDYQIYYPMVSPPPPTSTTYSHDPRAVAGVAPAPAGQEQRPGPRARGMSAPASTTLSLSAHSPEAPPPAYQTLHPPYDPSRYSQATARFSSSFEIPRSSTSTVAGNANRNTRAFTVSGALQTDNHTNTHNPNMGLSGTEPESSIWHQQQQGQQYQYHYQPELVASGSGSGSNWPSSSGRTTTTMSPESRNTSARDLGAEELGPRRPRPVLSRLITNL